MWEGYQEEIYKRFLDKKKELNIDIYNLHVSGHADYTAFNQVIEITNPNTVIPMHTENKEKIKEMRDRKKELQVEIKLLEAQLNELGMKKSEIKKLKDSVNVAGDSVD